MFHLYHDLLLDFQKLTYPKLIRLRDGGNGLHHHITAHFFANGMSKDISGCSFLLHWQKGDATTGACSLDTVTCDGHMVTFELPREILAGDPEVMLWLHVQNNDAVLHSFPFRLYVYQLLPSGIEVITE